MANAIKPMFVSLIAMVKSTKEMLLLCCIAIANAMKPMCFCVIPVYSDGERNKANFYVCYPDGKHNKPKVVID